MQNYLTTDLSFFLSTQLNLCPGKTVRLRVGLVSMILPTANGAGALAAFGNGPFPPLVYLLPTLTPDCGTDYQRRNRIEYRPHAIPISKRKLTLDVYIQPILSNRKLTNPTHSSRGSHPDRIL